MESTDPSASDCFSWTWGNAKLGTLTTVVQSDGTVRQERHHPKDANPSTNPWGRVSPESARQLIQQARSAIGDVSAASAVAAPFPPDVEFVEVRVTNDGEDRTRRVPVAELNRHGELAKLRSAVVAVRKQVSGGFLSWRSIGGRLVWLLIGLLGCMTWWIVRDWRETDRMERTAERLAAIVSDRSGQNGYDATKFIKVQFTPHSGRPTEQQIDQYLSAENWELAELGKTVRIWHDADTGHTYLEDDIRRWNRDKQWIPLLPIGIAIPIFIVCVYLSGYRVGVHDDGREYLIREDYVAGDDRDAAVDRTTYNMGRLVWWLAK